MIEGGGGLYSTLLVHFLHVFSACWLQDFPHDYHGSVHGEDRRSSGEHMDRESQYKN